MSKDPVVFNGIVGDRRLNLPDKEVPLVYYGPEGRVVVGEAVLKRGEHGLAFTATMDPAYVDLFGIEPQACSIGVEHDKQ